MAQGADFPPLYEGNEHFQTALKKSLVFPARNERIFDNKHIKMHRTLAVYSRAGMFAAQVVADYCRKHKVHFESINVDRKNIFGASDEFTHIVKQRIDEPANRKNLLVVILDHADVLAFDLLDESLQNNFALALEFTASTTNLIIVGVFEKQKQHQQSDYTDRFFKQFPFVTFLNSPPASFNAKFYEHLINSYCKASYVIDDANSKFTEGDFLMLADASPYATIENMLLFCQHVFYNHTFDSCESETPLPFTFQNFSKNFKEGGKLILTVASNAEQIENHFSASTIGMLAKAYPTAVADADAAADAKPPKILKREPSPLPFSPEEEEQEEENKKQKMDVELAWSSLKKAKH